MTVITLYPTSNSTVVISLLHSPDIFEARLLFMMTPQTSMRKPAMTIGIPTPPDTSVKQSNQRVNIG